MRVLILAGGESGEREVSLASGAAVWMALERLGHTVKALDPATGLELIGGGKLLVAPNSLNGSDSILPSNSMPRFMESYAGDTDVVFIGLHGGGGENGSIQNLLDLAGVVYTGSGMTASGICMNKAMTKRLMKSVGVATPDWELIRTGEASSLAELARETALRWPLPIIVKPNDGGSTVGLTKVDNVEDVEPALTVAFRESGALLVEDYIAGRELTVSVIDGRAFPVVEIIPKSGLYDYEAKYTKGKSEYVVPALVDSTIAEQARANAVLIYQVTECEGLARIDFILDESDRLFCLEVNTLPGMTELSLAPMAVGCEGIGFDQLVQMIIDSALRK